MKTIITIIFSLMLAACGGGGDGGDEPLQGTHHYGAGQWEGVDLNVSDGDETTYLKSYTDPSREVGARGWIRTYFPAYSGPEPQAVYIHITHATEVNPRDLAALNGVDLDRSGQKVTQEIYAGTAVPEMAELIFDFRNDHGDGPADPHVTVYEIWVEVVAELEAP